MTYGYHRVCSILLPWKTILVVNIINVIFGESKEIVWYNHDYCHSLFIFASIENKMPTRSEDAVECGQLLMNVKIAIINVKLYKKWLTHLHTLIITQTYNKDNAAQVTYKLHSIAMLFQKSAETGRCKLEHCLASFLSNAGFHLKSNPNWPHTPTQQFYK